MTIILGWLLGWLVLAGLVGAFAKSKGHSAGDFFGLSILLSPVIAFIIALVKEPNRAKVEQIRLASGGERKCPFCAELVKQEAIVCRFCGRDLPPPEKKTYTVKPGDKIYYSEGWFVQPVNFSPPLGPFQTREEVETAKRGEPPTPEAPTTTTTHHTGRLTPRAAGLAIFGVVAAILVWVITEPQGRIYRTRLAAPLLIHQATPEVHARSYDVPVATEPTPIVLAEPLDPQKVRNFIVASEQMEVAAQNTAAAIRQVSAADWRLVHAREARSQIGNNREQAVDFLNQKWSARPELAEARKHVERAIALDEDTCNYLDAIITELHAKEPTFFTPGGSDRSHSKSTPPALRGGFGQPWATPSALPKTIRLRPSGGFGQPWATPTK